MENTENKNVENTNSERNSKELGISQNSGNGDIPKGLEFFKVPLYDITELIATFNSFRDKIKKHEQAHPEDKGKYAVAVVEWDSDYGMTIEQSKYYSNEVLAVWINEKYLIEHPETIIPIDITGI